jgi:hypothetical protein
MVDWLAKWFDFSPSSSRSLFFKRFTISSILLLCLATLVYSLPMAFHQYDKSQGIFLFLLLGPHLLFSGILVSGLESAATKKRAKILSGGWTIFVGIPWILISIGCVFPAYMVPILFNWVFLGNIVGAFLALIFVEFQH